jgi:hypothetical protein
VPHNFDVQAVLLSLGATVVDQPKLACLRLAEHRLLEAMLEIHDLIAVGPAINAHQDGAVPVRAEV